MNESINPTGDGKSSDPLTGKPASDPTYKEQTADVKADNGESHIVMGMKMDQEQYDAFMKGLSDSVIQQIKDDEASYNRTQDEIRLQEQIDEG